jgi:hypothetical protein
MSLSAFHSLRMYGGLHSLLVHWSNDYCLKIWRSWHFPYPRSLKNNEELKRDYKSKRRTENRMAWRKSTM